MKNQPLSSSEQAKILVFVLLLTPSVLFLAGVVPAIFISLGVFMMKKNQDFSSIDTAVKYFKGYVWVAVVVCIGITVAICNERMEYIEYIDNYFIEVLLAPLGLIIAVIAHLILVQILFYNPLKEHKDWVIINGIFSNEIKSSAATESETVEIIKGGKLKQYSVADELLKWAKLKEDGHISEEEFNQAREKLLR